MRYYFTFAGVDSRSLGIYFKSPPELGGAVPRLNHISVPGRNGDLTQWDGSFENRTMTLQCYVVAERMATAMTAINKLFFGSMGYQRLELDTDPDHYLTAQVVQGPAQKPIDVSAGEFTITFDCRPQRWLKTGEIDIDVRGQNNLYPSLGTYPGANTYPMGNIARLQNDGFDSAPIIKLYGYGLDSSFKINNETFNIRELPQDGLVIDCESGNIYSPDGQSNLSHLVTLPTGQYPKLGPGENLMQWDGKFSRIVIMPRWYDL